MTANGRLDDAYRQARALGMFTGPAWTVLLITGLEPGAPLVPFEVHARTPHLAQIAAAAVLRSPHWAVIGVIPGHHPLVAGSRIVPAHQLAAEHPDLHATALEVADATLAAARAQARPHTPAGAMVPTGRPAQPARAR